MKTYETIIGFFEKEGIDTIFTLMSEDNVNMISEIVDGDNHNMRVIHSRHEQGAMAMADGYSRATRDIGVCSVGRGPAIAQTGTSLLTARNGGSKLLVLVPEMAISSDYDDKEFSQESYLETMVGEVISIRSDEMLIRSLNHAFNQLHAGKGPIAVQIPKDILNSEYEANSDVESAKNTFRGSESSRGSTYPDQRKITRAVDLYLDSDVSKPPIILAGRGAVASGAKESIIALAERMNALLVTSLQARGYFKDHPFYLGFSGNYGNSLANEFLHDTDCIVTVGCSLNPHTHDEGHLIRDEAKLIQIDTDPSNIERHFPIDLGIVGDARITVDKILEALSEENIDRTGTFWTDTLKRRINESTPFDSREFPEVPGTLDPRDVIQKLDKYLPDDRFLVTDGGHFANWALDGIQVTGPEGFIWTLDFAAIGQGLPIGIGAALTTRNSTCVTICGDAGFMMAIQELETAARNDVPMIVVVMNDSSLGSEYHKLDGEGRPPEAALIETPEFAKVAEAMGAEGYSVTTLADLDSLKNKLGMRPNSPIVIDCKINHKIRHRSRF